VHILEEIVQHKRLEVQKDRKERPVSELLAAIATKTPPRPFCKFLATTGQVAVIAEIKKASPSAGVIRRDFDPVSIAKEYQLAGASALSVLTDTHFFQGALSYLQQVHETSTLPCLRKDFMIDPYQVMEARAGDADLILLIMAVLSDAQYDEMAAAALEFKLEYLVEVHNAVELERAMKRDVDNIGINNRDLTTFEVDLHTTDKLLEIIPDDTIVVSESGLKSRMDIERFGKIGVDAVLIGESLMREPDIAAALRKLVGVEKWSR
jgi:indole-3-glycerol phosphate synthase